MKKPLFQKFEVNTGLDSLATKGVFGLCILWNRKPVWILNTHFQADFTEIPCCRKSYQKVRNQQELELLEAGRRWCKREDVLYCGDYNQESFEHLEYWKIERAATFPATGQHLDHVLFVKQQRTHLQCKKVHYYKHIDFSDHIPVLYEFEVS
jgi:hypothetical protein